MITKNLLITSEVKSKLAIDTLSFINKIMDNIKGMLLSVLSFVKKSRRSERTPESYATNNRKNIKFPNIKTGKVLRILLIIAVIGGALYGVSRLGTGDNDNNKIEVLGAKATQDINKEFSFPLKNNSGEDVSAIKYTIEKAELRDEIIVKGKRAKSVEGRTFLIVTLKIGNEYNRMIKINSRDYVRLSLNGNENEWLAAEVHNDPVEVQAISTKYTRLGFPIYDTDTDMVLRVGEIQGEKEMIPLNF